MEVNKTIFYLFITIIFLILPFNAFKIGGGGANGGGGGGSSFCYGSTNATQSLNTAADGNGYIIINENTGASLNVGALVWAIFLIIFVCLFCCCCIGGAVFVACAGAAGVLAFLGSLCYCCYKASTSVNVNNSTIINETVPVDETTKDIELVQIQQTNYSAVNNQYPNASPYYAAPYNAINSVYTPQNNAINSVYTPQNNAINSVYTPQNNAYNSVYTPQNNACNAQYSTTAVVQQNYVPYDAHVVNIQPSYTAVQQQSSG
jgi:hypothetical protein